MAVLRMSDPRMQRLYDLAVANLVLLSPDEVYPGPYTYKRFWFRDAAFILNAIVTLGGAERTRRTLQHFAPRQRHDGYFLSQEGEWDSNGEALWMYHRFLTLTGEPVPQAWVRAIARGARWIIRKRLPADTGLAEAGLLPAGFSAEHLGPNDFYYWDDFWGVAGLRSAAAMLGKQDPKFAGECAREADELLGAIERSFPRGPNRRFPGAIPASPKRRMDSGAVGSLVADYPLQIYAAGDERILKTADYLRDHSSHAGAFFQNMIHSGINAYLTLHLAQIRLRGGETAAAWTLMDRVASLASSTGQWPEAIHPRTGGGCMGDGEHMWAAAEWALMVRACFVREETGSLVLAAGLKPEWWRDGASLGPTLTPFGPVTVRVIRSADCAAVTVEGQWRAPLPLLDVRLPGFAGEKRRATGETETFLLNPQP
jgi:GH15 family glucan-1,4-alpha-glucosidase